MNGETSRYIETLDEDDPEYIRQLMRPVEVKEDVRQMAERKRVKLVLQSRLFRDELEDLVVEQMMQNGSPLTPNSISIQRLSDFLAPRVKTAIGNGVGPCIPISDIKSSVVLDSVEKTFRCKLASLYRLLDLLGWTGQGVQGGITGRISQEHERFLVSAYGILPHEVTTSNLVKVNSKGDILETPVNPLTPSMTSPGTVATSHAGVDKNEFRLHSAVYASRPDARCLIHLVNVGAVSISALHQGLLPINGDAASLGDISYFSYNGGHLDLEQRDKLRRALGPASKVLFLRNFGVMLIGESIEEAFWLAQKTMSGINAQLSLVRNPGGLANLKLLSESDKQAALKAARQSGADENGRRYNKGEKEFETMMKHLDNAGYRTGYPYREGVVKEDGDKSKRSKCTSVAEPPLVSSFVLDFDETTRSSSRMSKQQQAKGNQSMNYKSTKYERSFDDSRREETSDSGLGPTDLDVSRDSKWTPETTSTPIKSSHDPQRRADNKLEETVIAPSKKADQDKKKSAEDPSARSPPLGSPLKSSSSTDKELSPTHGATVSPTKEKKKKKGFFSSFNRKKDK